MQVSARWPRRLLRLHTRSAHPTGLEGVTKGFLAVYVHPDRVCSSLALVIKIDLEKYGQ